MEALGYLASLFVGIVLGLLGGGGSILAVPILVYLFRLDVIQATTYSLLIVGTTSLIGILPKYKKGMIDFKACIAFGIPSLILAFSTRKWIIVHIPDIIFSTSSFALTKRLLLMSLFSLLMISSSFYMIKRKNSIHAIETSAKTLKLILQGTLIGFLIGLLGVGGGFLIVPALMALSGLPIKIASGTSLFIIGISSLVGCTGGLPNMTIDWPFALSLSGIATGGIFLGNVLVSKISSQLISKLFGWLTLTVGIGVLIKELWTGSVQ